jgi:hypothetical protein
MRQDLSSQNFTLPPTYLRCKLTLNLDDYGKKKYKIFIMLL